MATPGEVITSITISNYAHSALESAFEHKAAFGLTKEKGNFEKKDGGEDLRFPLDVANYVAYDTDEYEDVSAKYVPTRQHVQAVLPWGQKSAFDALSKLSMKKNNGTEALVKFRDKNIPKMFRSVTSQGTNSMNYSFYYGTSTGSGLPMIGLAEMMVFDTVADTVKVSPVTAGTTYAGLSCVASGLSSTVTNADSDAWTPKSVNTNYDWDGDTTADGDLDTGNWRYIMDYAQLLVTKDPNDMAMRPDCLLCNSTYFNVGRNYIGDKQSIQISRPDKGNSKWGLGTSSDGFLDNGVYVFWDSEILTDRAYLLNFDQIGFEYLDPGPMISGDKYPGSTSGSGKDESDMGIFDVEYAYNPDRFGVKISATVVGQFRIHPRYQCLITKLTA